MLCEFLAKLYKGMCFCPLSAHSPSEARRGRVGSVTPDIASLASTSTALKPSLMRGRGTAVAVDEVPTQVPDFVVSLSLALESRITANLSPALRAGAGVCMLSVESRCPRRKLCGGVNPSNPPHRRTAAGGDGLRPAGAATLRSPQDGSVAPDILSLALI